MKPLSGRSKAKFLGEAGMSIMEIMVAAGLLSVVSLGVSSMMHNTGRAQRTIAMSNEFEILVQRVNQSLAKDAACSSFFRDYSLNLAAQIPALPAVPAVPPAVEHVVPSITFDVDGAGGPIAPVTVADTAAPPQAGLRITRISFIARNFLGPRPGAVGGDMNLVTMRIQGERRLPNTAAGQAGVGGSLVTKDLSITFLRDGAGNADTCYANFGADDFCAQVGGTWNAGAAQCDITPITCQDVGGTWVAPAGPCNLGTAAPLIDIDSRACSNIGGVFNAATIPRCQITVPPIGPNNPTTVAEMCARLGGSMIGNDCDVVTARCTAAGGTPTPMVAPGVGIYCDMITGPCTRAGGVVVNPGLPTAYCDTVTPYCATVGGIVVNPGTPTAFCDTRQPMCVALGGVWAGGRCTRLMQRTGCRNATIGDCSRGGSGFGSRSAGDIACNGPNEYISTISGTEKRETSGDVDSFCIHVQCCTN